MHNIENFHTDTIYKHNMKEMHFIRNMKICFIIFDVIIGTSCCVFLLDGLVSVISEQTTHK